MVAVYQNRYDHQMEAEKHRRKNEPNPHMLIKDIPAMCSLKSPRPPPTHTQHHIRQGSTIPKITRLAASL